MWAAADEKKDEKKEEEAAKDERREQKGRITVFSISGCAHCKAAKALSELTGVPANRLYRALTERPDQSKP